MILKDLMCLMSYLINTGSLVKILAWHAFVVLILDFFEGKYCWRLVEGVTCLWAFCAVRPHLVPFGIKL